MAQYTEIKDKFIEKMRSKMENDYNISCNLYIKIEHRKEEIELKLYLKMV